MAAVNTPNRHAIQTEAQLAEAVSQFYDDPYGFVMFAFPWGEEYLPDGSPGPLAKKKGPERWQRRLLMRLGQHIRDNIELKSMGLEYMVARYARASGHGVGKSALVAWLILFFMATRRDCRGAVTANTAAQLETRTWPELARWHGMFICKHWFVWTATSYYFGLYPPEKQKNYMFTAATVSEHNTDAFQGLHNEDGAVIVIFDEAGGLFPKLWEVAQGALTDGEPFFFAFGNPTDPDAKFAECFDNVEISKMYDVETIDSRDVSFTNKSALADMIKLWGEDSDEVRVRIKGQFPRNAYDGFISADALLQARERDYTHDPDAAIIMAVDVARFGRDKTVIRVRQGRYARRPPVVLRQKNNVEVADAVQREIEIVRPDDVVIESTGPGAGVIDILRDRKYRITEVHPGSNSDKPQMYWRKRDEWWGKFRDWLINEGCIGNEIELIEQLSKIKYQMDRHNTAIKIESKEEYMDRTKLTSPDETDSLVLTFASKVVRRDRNLDVRRTHTRGHEVPTEYDIFAY